METEKIQVNMAPGVGSAELVIREVKTVNELPVKQPVNKAIRGTIGTPRAFLEVRNGSIDANNLLVVDPVRSTIYIDRDKRTITLIVNENDEYLTREIVGQIEVHPVFAKFGINTEKSWEPNSLGQFFKMNRAYFFDSNENMALVTMLKNFEAKVNSAIEKTKSENGSFADNFYGTVTSNLPGTFKLKVPLFKGGDAETIDVEFYASVNGRTVQLQLFSPGAVAAQEEVVNELIDVQIELLKDYKNIPIVEV